MRFMRALREKFRKAWSGQAIVEYVIILAVFAAGVLVALPSFEDAVGTAYISSSNTVDPPSSPTPTVPPGLDDVDPEYTVRYVANGGSNAPAMQTKLWGVDLELSSTEPIYSNHTFVGWSRTLARAIEREIDFMPGDTYTENANMTLYASWESDVISYTLRYFVNSPDGATATFGTASSPIIRTKQHGISTTIISNVPTCAGYSFLGWNETSTAQVATYHSGDTFVDNRDADFYAIWVPATYTVSYHANGGSGSVPGEATYGAGATVTVESALLTKANYQFAGWSEDSSSSLVDYAVGTTFPMPDRDVDLYAVYMPTEFPYNGTNGTDGSVQSFTAPVTGTYQIQLWGARGGASAKDGVVNSASGNGGYTVVNVTLTRGQTIYFAVGGHGANNDFSRSTTAAALNPGGWNGGGAGITDSAVDEGNNFSSTVREGSGGGGGATSVYTQLLNDGQLSNYNSYRGYILGIAGGSSGANYTGSDGYGGGVSGGNGSLGGTQTAGYAFGVGESAA